jgi:hypothetical protein
MWYVWQDVAVKVFSKQEYSEDVIEAFRQEVNLHPVLQHLLANLLNLLTRTTSKKHYYCYNFMLFLIVF